MNFNYLNKYAWPALLGLLLGCSKHNDDLIPPVVEPNDPGLKEISFRFSFDYNYLLPESETLYAIASVKDSLGASVWDERYVDVFIMDGNLISGPMILAVIPRQGHQRNQSSGRIFILHA
ncbi:MAG TPA: hypothetical protein VI583_04970 [Cyclobacteriaceae bacterium]|nr:hypothetical protein [Cyclobacteriaceae bacterium]